jgi:hypothetical protein
LTREHGCLGENRNATFAMRMRCALQKAVCRPSRRIGSKLPRA